MTYMVNEFSGDFQQGGSLSKPTSENDQWTSEYSWTSDKPQKQASEKAHHVNYWQWCFGKYLVY